ncbi:DUF4297 domain-containing protein [Leptospira yasudae]|uniref:dsDNA nuclease domain-containing protein n=1 Tax=Leptospira yasudae TaxID=2202201 RepID=UPI001C4F96F6|nr:dsDNA nuclease domain-containing protein [Leptospira yasudae]MBW0436018.1 DUF4297 domain-containing protein [Leptospira yasudae]
MNKKIKEIETIASDDSIVEYGGAHNQKGIEFQRNWALVRIFQLTQDKVSDFLLLFETFQDIAEFDSSSNPDSVIIYQIKKNDRTEWSWGKLTALKNPQKKGPKADDYLNFAKSPIGKLFHTVNKFQTLRSQGKFISNHGCDLMLESGGNAATASCVSLADLEKNHVELISKAIKSIHGISKPSEKLSVIYLEKSSISIDDPRTYVIGIAHSLLNKILPRHVGQTSTLVDTLLVTIGSLSSKTDKCKSFRELVAMKGFSKKNLDDAIQSLNQIPDILSYLDIILTDLSQKGFTWIEIIKIKASVSRIYSNLISAGYSEDEKRLIGECDSIIATKSIDKMDEIIISLYDQLKDDFKNISKYDIIAHLLIRVIQKCEDQI